MKDETTLIMMIISIILVIFLFGYLLKKYKKENTTNQIGILYKEFICVFALLIIHITGLILQIGFSYSSINPIYFDYITYISGVYLPVMFMMVALTYETGKGIRGKRLLLFIIPTFSLLMLWTNDLHSLFYIKYSINISEGIVGPIFYIYSVYSYVLIFVAMVMLVRTSMKKSGFFSMQTALIILGGLVPIVPNLLGTLKLISMNIYITPILFIVTSICYSLAIIKFKALNITPIAFRTVIDTMSDAFIVISDDGTIVDSNKTFKNTFKGIFKFTGDENLFNIIEKNGLMNLEKLKKNISDTRKKGKILMEEYHIKIAKKEKFFEIDIHPITAKNNSKEYVGTLLLFKDVTQHKEDMKKIEEKQEIIVKQGQLVTIGELAGGVAHDINTPISAMKTGIYMLTSMTGERTEQEKELLQSMDNCANKIITIVNSMRNQIRNIGGDTNEVFKVSNVVNDVRMITYYEIGRNGTKMNINIKEEVSVKGDPTKLSQVLTNLVVNAGQAYGKDKSGTVEVEVNKVGNKAKICVTDTAGGIPGHIAPYVFKNILTTKGTAGTGLGLYLAYSVIKAEFNGDITFKTKIGEGTTFIVSIPLA